MTPTSEEPVTKKQQTAVQKVITKQYSAVPMNCMSRSAARSPTVLKVPHDAFHWPSYVTLTGLALV